MDNSFNIGDAVLCDGILYRVIDICDNGTYDLREANGDGERLDIPPQRLQKTDG